jgi:hypothetical protein
LMFIETRLNIVSFFRQGIANDRLTRCNTR